MNGRPGMMLGRKPTILPARHLKLGAYIRPDIAPPPDTAEWGSVSRSYSMLKNDTVGDCVIADTLHSIQDAIEDNGGTFQPTDQQAIALYSAVTGYNPADPSTDQGTDPVAMMDYWKTTGVYGHKILGYLAIDPTDRTQLKVAIAEFGGVHFAWDVPAYAMDQFEAGKPFDIDDGGDQTIEGGHMTWHPGYFDAAADPFGMSVCTWGTLVPRGMTWRFAAKYGEIPLVAVSADWLAGAGGKAPSGLDIEKLMADLVGEASL